LSNKPYKDYQYFVNNFENNDKLFFYNSIEPYLSGICDKYYGYEETLKNVFANYKGNMLTIQGFF
jgi:hypothetical protein